MQDSKFQLRIIFSMREGIDDFLGAFLKEFRIFGSDSLRAGGRCPKKRHRVRQRQLLQFLCFPSINIPPIKNK